MKINFTNINFDNDIKVDSDIAELNLKIKNVCSNLPAKNCKRY